MGEGFPGGGGHDLQAQKICNSPTGSLLAAKTAPKLQITQTRKQ